MGGICSTGNPQVPQNIEENIFDILPRDPVAPDDLFKPLDVHFARNHSLSSLLAQFTSRRLPLSVVSTIWRHYFESFLVEPTPTASLHSLSPSNSKLLADTHKLLEMPLVGSGGGLASGSSAHVNMNGELIARNSSFGTSSRSTAPQERDIATPSELNCMMWLVTDILRHDLACLKERYDEVLAASLAMPQEQGATSPTGFAFNPVPVLKAIRQDLQRLNNMPIDYLARILIKEMKGVGEDDELSVVTPRPAAVAPAHRRDGSSGPSSPNTANANPYSSNQLLSPTSAAGPAANIPSLPPPVGNQTSPGGSNGSASPAGTGAGGVAAAGGGGGSTSPLDRPVSITPRVVVDGPAPPSARIRGPLPNLSFELFHAHIDFSMKNLFDRYYRKGFWVFFSLNLMVNARKFTNNALPMAILGGSSASGTGGGIGAGGAGVGGSWGDRIMAASYQSQSEQTTPIRKKGSLSSSSAGGGGGSSKGATTSTQPVNPHPPTTLKPPSANTSSHSTPLSSRNARMANSAGFTLAAGGGGGGGGNLASKESHSTNPASSLSSKDSHSPSPPSSHISPTSSLHPAPLNLTTGLLPAGPSFSTGSNSNGLGSEKTRLEPICEPSSAGVSPSSRDASSAAAAAAAGKPLRIHVEGVSPLAPVSARRASNGRPTSAGAAAARGPVVAAAENHISNGSSEKRRSIPKVPFTVPQSINMNGNNAATATTTASDPTATSPLSTGIPAKLLTPLPAISKSKLPPLPAPGSDGVHSPSWSNGNSQNRMSSLTDLPPL